MKTKLLANPFYLYILSFGAALIIYSWQWSEIYPRLSIEVIVFLLFSFIISFLLGSNVSEMIKYVEVSSDKNNAKIGAFIIISYAIEIVYNGGIPLFLLFKNGSIDYMNFGIPTFHVFLHTFTSFYTIYSFQQFIDNKNYKTGLLVLILLLPNILIVNRGALIMTVTACAIIYIFKTRIIAIKRVAILIVLILSFFYGFGYLGNQRSFNGDPYAFLKLTDAREDYVNSNIPKEYYWFYIYASSPFANFQNATILSKRHRYDVSTFLTWEFLPDFISKRIIPLEQDHDGNIRTDFSVNPLLTVGSMYFEPFIRMGWVGPISIFFHFVCIIYLYVKFFLKKDKYFVSGLAILCVFSIFSMFENMINFSGLSFQLVYPILLSKINNFKYNINLKLLTTNIVFKW